MVDRIHMVHPFPGAQYQRPGPLQISNSARESATIRLEMQISAIPQLLFMPTNRFPGKYLVVITPGVFASHRWSPPAPASPSHRYREDRTPGAAAGFAASLPDLGHQRRERLDIGRCRRLFGLDLPDRVFGHPAAWAASAIVRFAARRTAYSRCPNVAYGAAAARSISSS